MGFFCMQKQILVNGFAINRSKIERDIIDNKECIILRDVKSIKQDTVMNGMLYKADIVANTYQQLNDVLAPYSHPKRPNGDLLASTDWMAINEFHVGAKNINARLQTDGWVVNDIVIDVAYAGNSDRGRDLLNRIERMEAGEDVTLATSTGLYYSANNEEGEENGRKYTRVVTAMSFEHNAMLDEDETAAGLGCGFTANNEVVEQVSLDELATDKRKKSLVKKVVNFLAGNQELSFELIRDLLYAEIRTFGDNEYSWIDSVFDEYFIYEKNSKYYRQNYSLNDGKITLIEAAQEVEKQIEFIAISTESDQMTLDEIKVLLTEQSTAMLAANSAATTAAIKPLTDKIAELETQLTANADKELDIKRLAVKTKFGLTDEAVKDMGVNALDAMYAQTTSATAITANITTQESDKALFVDFNAQLEAMETK